MAQQRIVFEPPDFPARRVASRGGLWRLIVCVFVLAWSAHAYPATYTLTASTNWSALAPAPTSADIIIVKNGAILVADVANGQCASLQLGSSTAPQAGNGVLSFSAGAQITVAGAVTLGAGASTGSIDMKAGGTLTLAQFTVVTLGSWAPGAGTVVMTGNNTLPFGTFNNLTVNSNTTTLGANITLLKDLYVATGATLNSNAHSIGSGGSSFFGNLRLDGVNSGTGDINNSGSNITISGTGSKTNTSGLTLSGGAKTIAAGTNLTIASGVTISGAITVTNNGSVTITSINGLAGTVAGSTWTNATNSTLSAAGPLLATGTLTASASGNTVNYSGAAQSVKLASATYFNLILSGNGGKTIGTAAGQMLTVGGSLTIAAGANYLGATFNPTANLAGNFSNSGGSGTFTSGSGVFTFNGTSPQLLTEASASGTVFTNLTINNTTATLATRTVTLSQGLGVPGNLTFTNGIIDAGSQSVRIGAGGSVTRGASCAANGCFVIGKLIKNFAGTPGVQSQTYEIGSVATGVAYAPVTLTVSGAKVGGDIGISTTAGDHPNLGTSTLDPNRSANRYWTITNTTLAFPSGNANKLSLGFVASDVDSGANPLNFSAGRYSAATWNIIPNTNLTALATSTVIGGASSPFSSTTLTGDYAVAEASVPVPTPSSFNAFETSTPAGAINGRIYTKLAGTAFNLDVVAISAGAQLAAFTASVNVSLVANTTGAALGVDNCPTTFTVVQGPTTANITGGRSTVSFAAVGTAYRDVRVRVQYVGAPAVSSCSTDDFAIRPVAFSSVTSNLTNAATSGAPVARAGDLFTLTAAAVAGYDGTPTINAALVTAHAGAVQVGTIGGTFGAAIAATGTASGSAFTYSETGNFTLGVNAVNDAGFTAVDSAAGDCTNDFSNAPVGGRYGCLFGNSSASAPVGRFTPDHFTVAANAPVFATACSGFTYVGQSFSYSTAPVITVTARNSAALGNATTRNYTGAWWKISNATLTYPAAVAATRGYAAFTGSLDVSGLPATDPVVVDTGGASSGTGTLTFGSGSGLLFVRGAPSVPFNADIGLSINVIDADGIIYTANPAVIGAATAGNGMTFSDGNAATVNDKEMRYGRLRMQNANGSELLPLTMQLTTQYFTAGAGFIDNVSDNCTTLASANVGLGNYQLNLNTGATTATIAAGAFANGVKTLTFSAPGANKFGSADVVINLGATTTTNVCLVWSAPAPAPAGANRTYLRDLQSCSAGAYNRDPTARATFGAYGINRNFIYQRENY